MFIYRQIQIVTIICIFGLLLLLKYLQPGLCSLYTILKGWYFAGGWEHPNWTPTIRQPSLSFSKEMMYRIQGRVKYHFTYQLETWPQIQDNCQVRLAGLQLNLQLNLVFYHSIEEKRLARSPPARKMERKICKEGVEVMNGWVFS